MISSDNKQLNTSLQNNGLYQAVLWTMSRDKAIRFIERLEYQQNNLIIHYQKNEINDNTLQQNSIYLKIIQGPQKSNFIKRLIEESICFIFLEDASVHIQALTDCINEDKIKYNQISAIKIANSQDKISSQECKNSLFPLKEIIHKKQSELDLIQLKEIDNFMLNYLNPSKNLLYPKDRYQKNSISEDFTQVGESKFINLPIIQGVRSLLYSEQHEILLIGEYAGKIWIIDTITFKIRGKYRIRQNLFGFKHLTFSFKKQTLAVSMTNSKTIFLRFKSQRRVKLVKTIYHPNPICSSQLFLDDHNLYLCLSGGSLEVRNSNNYEYIQSIKVSNQGCGTQITYMKKHQKIVFTNSEKEVLIYGVPDFLLYFTYKLNQELIQSVQICYHQDQDQIIMPASSQGIQVFKVQENGEELTPYGHIIQSDFLEKPRSVKTAGNSLLVEADIKKLCKVQDDYQAISFIDIGIDEQGQKFKGKQLFNIFQVKRVKKIIAMYQNGNIAIVGYK